MINLPIKSRTSAVLVPQQKTELPMSGMIGQTVGIASIRRFKRARGE